MGSPRDYTITLAVSLTKVEEVKAAKFGRRTYFLLDNSSNNAIKFDSGVAPGDNNGITIAAGIRYERFDRGVPQSTFFIRGTVATDQIISVSQGFED